LLVILAVLELNRNSKRASYHTLTNRRRFANMFMVGKVNLS